ncbi:MAG: ABC transporter ATP-binding protein [Chloroflexia bacterium]|nr:ABC transporter ATP-binding protein [Chloroflexia bacterium]
MPLLDTLTIWLYKRLIDDALVPREFAALIPIALTYLGLTLLAGVIGFGRDYLSAWIGEQVLLSVRMRLFRHLQDLSLLMFDRRRLGDVMVRVTDDVDEVELLVVTGPSDAIAAMLKILFFTGALFYLNWRLALVALIVAPPFWITARHFSSQIRRAAREQRSRGGAISALAEESLANISLVQAYNQQGAESDRFEREVRGEQAAQLRMDRLRAIYTPVIDLLELGGILVVVGMGAWELSQGRLSLGGLLAFLAYLSQLYGPIRTLTRLTTDIFAAAAGAERVIELLEEQPAVVEHPDPIVLDRATGRLALEVVSYRYPEADRDALDRVSFALAPGETLAIVGASGAGKSTLIKLLLRFEDPRGGRILLDGHDLRDLSLRSLRDNTAVVLQEVLLFDGSIRENIAYGRPGATEREIVDAAKAADADTFIRAFPDGYATRVGQRGRSLSGGQRQRIAIARAMIRDAPLLILDEPTTGLDAATGERILEPLRRLIAGRTTIIVSHNLLTVRDADQIIVLDGGRVVERGDHAELLLRGGTYAHLYQLHQQAPEKSIDEMTATMPGSSR